MGKILYVKQYKMIDAYNVVFKVAILFDIDYIILEVPACFFFLIF